MASSLFPDRPSIEGKVVSVTPRNKPNNKKLIEKLTSQLQEQQQAQRTAAEQQRSQLMSQIGQTTGEVQDLYGEAREQAQGVGTAARQRISDQAARNLAQQQQQMLARGLSGTTIAPAMQRGVAADAERQQQSVDEQQAQLRSGLAQQQAGTTQQLGQWAGQGILSAQHQPPQMGVYMQLLQQLAGGR